MNPLEVLLSSEGERGAGRGEKGSAGREGTQVAVIPWAGA